MIPRTLMVCVESTETFDLSKEELGWLARCLSARVVLYHVLHPRWFRDRDPTDDDDAARDTMDRLAADPALEGVDVSVVCDDTTESLPDAILDAADRLRVDCVVVPTHGRTGFRRLVSGSVAEWVLKSCDLPVLTINLDAVPDRSEALEFDRVIATVDFSEIADRAIPRAIELARELECPVTLLHTVDDYLATAPYFARPPSFTGVNQILMDGAERLMRQTKERHAGSGFPLETRVVLGRLIDGVRDEAARCRNPLIVMATAGRDSIGDHVLGSRTERCMRVAHCTVLTLPAAMLTESPAPA